MSTYKIDVYIPFRRPFKNQKVFDYLYTSFADLIDISDKIEFVSESFGAAKVSIKDAEIDEANLKLFQTLIPYFDYYKLIQFSSTLSIKMSKSDIRNADGTHSQMGDEEFEEIVELVLVDHYLENVYNFLVAIQLARPGMVHNAAGLAFLNDKYSKRADPMYCILREACDYVSSYAWPKLHLIDIIKVWKWIQEDMEQLDNFSKTPVQRALHAFTYLFGDFSGMDTANDLIWALIGIEAVFVRGKEGISEQIHDKTQILLGERKDYKKIVKQMYTFRSNLIHGTMDIPSRFTTSDASEDYENYSQDFGNSTYLAAGILTATLQELILKNKKSLEFKYIIIE